MNPLHVHTKKAKGKTYYYFDTGQKKPGGQAILTRLPDKRDPLFGRALATARAQRNKREKIPEARNFDWLVRAYEASPEFKRKAANTKRLYSRHLGYASAQFRRRDGVSWPVEIIGSEHVIALRDKMQDTPGKANAILKSLSAMLTWASSGGRKFVSGNYAKDVELLEMGEHEPWPLPLLDMALHDPAIRLPVAMLYYVGQRIGDTVKIGPGNLERDVIVVTQEKTGTTVRVPMHEHLKEIIEADAADGPTYLTNEWGKPVTDSGIRQRIQKWARGKGFDVVPHGLRKNAVNSLLEAGCSIAEVSAITGQSISSIEHYGKARDKEQLAGQAMGKMPRRTNGGRENHA
jgi:integrase